MSRLPLTPPQRAQLEHQLRTTRDAGLFRRTLAVLEAARGLPITEVARLVRASRMSVHHWIDCYDQTRDPTSLLDHRGGNHPTAWTEELEVVLSASLARRPADFGYQAMGWTVSLLQQHLARWGGQWLSATTLRRKLDELGYTWKRPRYVLDPDPERGKKTPHPLAVAAVGPGVRPAV